MEAQIDGGPWVPATPDRREEAEFAWKIWSLEWQNPSPGEHTIVSRVTDTAGNVQPTAEELAVKKTFLEDNSQYPRKLPGER